MASPVMIILLPWPMRVRNIFIWVRVVFWASSRMMMGAVERAAAHVGEGDDLHDVAGDEAADGFEVHHVVEGVKKRAEVGVHLGLQVARKETELFAGLDRGADQDDLADAADLEEVDRRSDREVGLAGAAGADGDHHVVVADGVEIGLLVRGAGADGLARDVDVEGVAPRRGQSHRPDRRGRR